MLIQRTFRNDLPLSLRLSASKQRSTGTADVFETDIVELSGADPDSEREGRQERRPTKDDTPEKASNSAPGQGLTIDIEV